MNIKRDQLKSYFRKKAIPTELQFAELIDGTLNQADDGLVKKAGEALGIEAVGDDVSMKKVLRFFYDEAAQTAEAPDFTLDLRAYKNKDDLQSGRRGLSITTANKESRIFVDYGNGNVGIGTADPQAALHVVGDARIDMIHPVLPWVVLPDSTKFTTDSPNRTAPACSRDAHGYVQLRGVFKFSVATAVGDIVTTLGEGYRPAESTLFVVTSIASASFAVSSQYTVEVQPSGDIKVQSAVAAGARWLPLDSICFPAAPLV